LNNDMKPTAELIEKTFNEINTPHVQDLNTMLSALDNWNEVELRNSIQVWLAERALSLKDIGGALRVALLGQSNSPELFQVLEVLGKEKVSARITKCLISIKQHHT